MNTQGSDQPAPGQAQLFCPNCHGGNPPDARNCMWCGSPLGAAAPSSGQHPQPANPTSIGASAQPQPPQYSQQQPYYPQPQPSQPYAPQPLQTAAKSGGVSPVLIILGVVLVAIVACGAVGYFLVTRTVSNVTNSISTGLSEIGTSVATTATALAKDTGSGINPGSFGGQSGPTAVPVERVLSTTPPRSFKYADLQFTVTKGVISNKDTAGSNPDVAALDLTLSVTNPTKDYVGVNTGLMQLKLGNGAVYKKRFDTGIQARDTNEYTLSFEVPLTTTWQGAQLSLDESDTEPATVVLEGAAPAPQYPLKLAAGAEATVKSPPLTYKLKDGLVDLDGMGKRAAKDKRYLVLSVVVSNKEQVGNVFVGSENFRIIVNGTPMSAEKLSPAAKAVDPLSEQEFQMAFLVPASATTAELQVGEASKDTASIPLDLKGAKP